MIASVPSMAFGSPPLTGASRNSTPFAAHAAATFCATIGAGIGPRTFVLNEPIHRHNLIRESAGLLRRDGLLVAQQRELVGVLARNSVLPSNPLGCQPHGHIDLGAMVHEPGIRRRLESTARRHTHRLAPTGDHHMRRARANPVRRQRDGLQSRAAEAIDGHARNRVRQPRPQQRHARQIVARSALRHRASQDHVLDIVPHLRIAIDQRADHHRGQVVGPRMAQRAARSLPHRRAQTVDDHGVGHILSVNTPRAGSASRTR